MRPEWIIYKNDIAIGKGVTWTRALEVLIKLESLDNVNVHRIAASLYIIRQVEMMRVEAVGPRYKIVRER